MAKQTVALYTLTSGDRAERARTSLAEALGGAQLGEADDGGAFDVAVDAGSPEEAVALVREAFARAGTGDDFVIRETTEGREVPADDPRQAPGGASGDRATRVADAASAVAAAASTAASSDAAEAARTAAGDAAESVRDAAASARESLGERGFSATASDIAAEAGRNRFARLAPAGALFLLLLIVLRRSRR